MSYGCSLENLLVILQEHDRIKAEAISKNKRLVEYGFLSVGLKIHCIGDDQPFAELVERLGGRHAVFEANVYRRSQAAFCMVLPPVGSANTAIMLLECIERCIDLPLFGNPHIQIQVCSPHRLSSERAALLAIGFYLGSDTLWCYKEGMFQTTVSNDAHYQRGERLVIHDANGDFDKKFAWWEKTTGAHLSGWRSAKLVYPNLAIRPKLPFQSGRTDILGARSKVDIANINLLATLLVHAEYGGCTGFWKKIGQNLESDIRTMLDEHMLMGLINAPWVRTPNESMKADEIFLGALQELIAYAFDETRVHNISNGILDHMRTLLVKYREKVVERSRELLKGDRT